MGHVDRLHALRSPGAVAEGHFKVDAGSAQGLLAGTYRVARQREMVQMVIQPTKALLAILEITGFLVIRHTSFLQNAVFTSKP